MSAAAPDIEKFPVPQGAASAVGGAPGEGAGCHGGKEQLRRAAAAAGKSQTLSQYAADYPAGPHD